ncbi:hypothetical protein BT96DRAFT_931449 [Gymnopus androsaceus JB14]|uniref:Uncharacterized protein n=1 Tax=Gymnopus androsaceus JB14 TaxID=1447944 RepID=A0A6A4IM87_9AGAR|nr:hypothetical protein BT96DRAFT_931449 [Gymnopus androsaceus JB14]
MRLATFFDGHGGSKYPQFLSRTPINAVTLQLRSSLLLRIPPRKSFSDNFGTYHPHEVTSNSKGLRLRLEDYLLEFESELVIQASLSQISTLSRPPKHIPNPQYSLTDILQFTLQNVTTSMIDCILISALSSQEKSKAIQLQEDPSWLLSVPVQMTWSYKRTDLTPACKTRSRISLSEGTGGGAALAGIARALYMDVRWPSSSSQSLNFLRVLEFDNADGEADTDPENANAASTKSRLEISMLSLLKVIPS